MNTEFQIYPMLSAPRKCKLTSAFRDRPPTAYSMTRVSRRSTLETRTPRHRLGKTGWKMVLLQR